MVDAEVTVDWGRLGCSVGLGSAKREGPGPVLPGKANIEFVVEVVLGGAGVGWLVGNENFGVGVAAVLEVAGVGGAGVAGLEKKLGTVVLVAVVEGSGFAVAVVAGLAKKLGTAGCAGTGTVVEGVGAGAGVAKKLFADSLVSVVVVPVVGFGCVEAVEVGVNKFGVVVAVVEVEVAVVDLNEIAGFLSSVTFWS